MKYWRAAGAALFLAACYHPCAPRAEVLAAPTAPAERWISIFNGEDLTGWTPKFAHHGLGENVADIFRVKDGLLTVTYEDWQGPWRDEFGHLYYDTPYSHYRLRLEYRFTGDNVPGSPPWTKRNSGVMLHSQPPETMGHAQFFPVSVEAQFLAEGANAAPTTGNLCTPEITVLLNGERSEDHCFNSSQPGLPVGEWVRAELHVDGGNIRHFINGVEVLSYTDPMTDIVQPWAPDRNLTSGFIALQAEASPVEFRNIEILILDPPTN